MGYIEMNTPRLGLIFLCAFLLSVYAPSEPVNAGGPIIARGAQREAIKSTHILHRPNRPFHIYGNTVRRRHSRRR